MIVLATAAAAATLWYLWPIQSVLLANFVAALAILALPLWRWLPDGHYGRIAAVWFVGGALGAYFFGVLILAAGAVTALGVAVRRYRSAAL